MCLLKVLQPCPEYGLFARAHGCRVLTQLHAFCAGIAIGGDTFPGSTLSDHCIRYQNIPQIKMIVVLGELGGRDEYSLVDALKSGQCQTLLILDTWGVSFVTLCCHA
jgi:hypothetical protein